MALQTNSYGDLTEIASLVPRYATNAGSFDGGTRPTLDQVTSFADQVSGLVNAMLAQNGFTIPVSQADAKLALDLFVNQEVAAICEGINGSGRFGPTGKRGGERGRFALIVDDVRMFIDAHALGFERLGAARTLDPTAGIAYRNTDMSGTSTAPIFQREAFGESYEEWDT